MKRSLLILAVSVFGISTSNVQAQTDSVFGDALNKCLSGRGASVVECSRIAALVSDHSGGIRVIENITLKEPTGASESVEVCNTPSPGGYMECKVYDCEESASLQQSVCTFTGWCFYGGAAKECGNQPE